MGDGTTKELHVIAPPQRWAAHAMKIIGNEFVGAKDLVYHDGQYFFAGQRGDGLWVAARLTVRSGMQDELVRGKPYRQILGHTVGGGQALYVAFPDDNQDNWPRVVGHGEGDHYEVIDHENLLWADGEPHYPAWKAGKVSVVRGKTPGKFYDQLVGRLDFVAGRVLYRARLGKEMFLVWGTDESNPCDDISPPRLEGKEIVAWGTRSLRLYRLVHKIAA